MIVFGATRRVELNGETIRDSGWVVSVKFKGWCFWHHSSEAGMRVIQVGPVVLEKWCH